MRWRQNGDRGGDGDRLGGKDGESERETDTDTYREWEWKREIE